MIEYESNAAICSGGNGLKKGDIVTGIIDHVNFPNRGILKADGLTVTVKDTVPGQQVEARITKKHGDRADARLLRVIEPSPAECKAPCAHFGSCGGCTWLNLPYEEELKLKETQVKKLLDQAVEESRGHLQAAGADRPDRVPEETPGYEFQGILPSPVQFGYRNKMEFTFGDEYKDGPLALGMHKRGSNFDLVTVSDCRIVSADYRAVLEATLGFFGRLYDEKKISFYHRMAHKGFLRHLLVRQASHTGEMLVDLITTTQEEHAEDIAAWCESLKNLPLEGHITGILHTRNDSLSDTIEDQDTEVLYGTDVFTEELLGLRFRITPFSFFQTNSRGAEILYETARAWLWECGLGTSRGSMDTIFDLYSGTGTIAQLMAPAAGKVIGVEIVEEAVRAARENAAMNGLTNCEFIAGDVLKVLDTIEEKPDLIILDPPRDGIHPKALPKILAYGVPYILYISCKPTSLARDIAGFAEAGYRLQKAVCVDQFPWTANVETIALFSRLDQMKP